MELAQLRLSGAVTPEAGTSTPPIPAAGKDCQRRAARQNLDKMIQRVEAARQSWESPLGKGAEVASASPPGKEAEAAAALSRARLDAARAQLRAEANAVAGAAHQSDDDFLAHLEEFQRRTDALQSQIASMQSHNAAQLTAGSPRLT
mmetsp:Transcript_8666/g.21863  ORF Transcript_8666/g.21863 Transcript_8666/m.21863 type:complete len:147 (+) Transcript_8666:172-612(+)